MFDFATYGQGLASGTLVTIWLIAVSTVIGIVIGLVFGILKASPNRLVRLLAAIYVDFIRGIPILIILMFLYFALPLMNPAWKASRGVTAIVGLSVYAGAYLAEIFRGSILAIPNGQTEAAKALGMRPLTRMRDIVLPQALKISVPPTIGFILALVKASSFVSVIGYTDLTRAGKIISSQNMAPLSTWVVIGVIYFVISYPISLLGRWLERKLGVDAGLDVAQ